MRRSRPAPRKPEKRLRTNDQIRAPEVRVVTEDGEQLGVLSTSEALRRAEERDLDLIEVAPKAEPPVCRIMSYGKFRYEQRKKEKESQKKSRQIEVKGVRVRPNTGEHDLEVKARNARKFLLRGHKVKFNVIFRGPELRHKEIGRKQLLHFQSACEDIADTDQSPRMEARNMTMILTPKPEVVAAVAAGKRGDEGSDKDGKGKAKNQEGRGEAVQDNGDGASPAQEGGAEPPPVEEVTET